MLKPLYAKYALWPNPASLVNRSAGLRTATAMHNHLDESHFRQNTQCPSGTEFYVCYANKFRGCCSTNPCDLQSCPDNSNPAESGGNPSEPQRTPTTASSAPTRDMHASWQSRTDAGPITTAQHPSTADEAPGTFTINSSTSFAQTGVDPPAETKGQGTPPPDSESNVLSVGAIVGITVGLAAAVVAFAFTITIWRSRRKGSRLSRHTDRGHDTPNTEHAPNQEYRVDIAQFPEECTAENQNPAVRVSSGSLGQPRLLRKRADCLQAKSAPHHVARLSSMAGLVVCPNTFQLERRRQDASR